MKKIIISILMFATINCFAQQPNTTNTVFNNGLEASKFFNTPALASPTLLGLKPGALNYFNAVSKPAYYDGTSFRYFLSETNAALLYYSKIQADAMYKNINYVPTWTEILNKPTFFSGNYNDLTNKPDYTGTFIKDNKTNIPEAKTIYISDSVKTTGVIKGSDISTMTPFVGPVNTSNDSYSFRNSKTRTGRLGLFYNTHTIDIPYTSTERWFFGSGGSMVFLPGKKTGDSHSGGILLGDRDISSNKTFGFYTQGGLGRIAFNSDTLFYNFTNTYKKDLMTYDENGVFKLPLSNSKFIIASSTDNGAALQVTGKATVSVAPTNPTDVVRLQDLPSSYIIDAVPTSGSTNAVSSGGTFNALTLKADDNKVVHIDGPENVNGEKNFLGGLQSSGYLQVNNFVPNGDATYYRQGSILKYVGGLSYILGIPSQSSTIATIDDVNFKQNKITLTTTGTGAATFNQSTGALNIPVASGGGSGSVTSVTTTGNNGISGVVTNPTTTPSIALTADTAILRTASNSLTKAQTQTALNLKGNLSGGNDWNGVQTILSGYLGVGSSFITSTGIQADQLNLPSISMLQTVSGTNTRGGITLVNKNSATDNINHGVNIYPNSLLTGTINIFTPVASGTLARLEDLPSLAGYMDLTTNQTAGGNKTFSNIITATGGINSKANISYTDAAGNFIYNTNAFTSGTTTKAALQLYVNNTTGPTFGNVNIIPPSPLVTSVSFTLPNQTGTAARLEDLADNFTASGNGSSTTISIPHGKSSISSTSVAYAVARNAAAAGISYVTTDATNINIVYTVAPVSGTNNLSYTIFVRRDP